MRDDMKGSVHMALGALLGMWFGDVPLGKAFAVVGLWLAMWLLMDAVFWFVGQWWRTRGRHA